MKEVHRAIDGIDDPLDFAFRIAQISRIAFLANATAFRVMLEEDLIDQVLALLVSGDFDVVFEFFRDLEFLAESVAKTFAGGLRGGDGSINHPMNIREVERRGESLSSEFFDEPCEMRNLGNMAIPLEDLAADVVGKAQRGLGLSNDALAEKLGIKSEELDAVKEVKGVSVVLVEALAEALELGPRSLIALAEGRHFPQAKPPSPGFFQTNTPFGAMTVNAYLVWDPETRLAAAFDTGADATPLVEEIKKQKLTLQDIFLTHTHIDHVMELDRLCEKVGGSIGIHAPEAEPLEGAALFKPGVTFSLGRLHIETRDTSGHSPGGTTYHIHGLDAPLVIVGDALFAGSVGGIKSDYHAALRRIRDNILSVQDNTTIAPGHGPLTTVKDEKMNNPFFPEFRQVLAKDI